MTEYGRMTPEEFVEHLIDEQGLVAFLDTQWANQPYEDWDWKRATTHLQGFSRGYLTFSPGYLKDLYEMQRARLAVALAEQAA